MTQEELQQKFELFVEAMNVPLMIIREKKVPQPITPLVVYFFTILLFYPSLIFVMLLLVAHKFIYWSILCWGLFLSGIIVTIREKKKEKNKKIKKIEIIINYNGIDTHEVGFWGWEDIHDEHIRYDKNTFFSKKPYLCYECPNGHIKVLLSDYDFYIPELEFYLQKYREFHYIKKNTFNL